MSTREDMIARLLGGMNEENEVAQNHVEYTEDDLSKLKAAYEKICKQETFTEGQIVKWKPSLKHKKLPHEKQPAIVVKVLSKPIIPSDSEADSPYFLENLDIILGVMSEEGTFLTFYYDSSRFEPY